MAALTPELRSTVAGYLKRAQEGTLVQSVNALHDFLLGQKLAWNLKLSPELVGVHPENRDGLGISASHVQELITNIASIGFSTAESRAVCLEVPADSRGDMCREFNRRLSAEANEKLAPVNPTMLKYASIVGSHANQAARCFVHGVCHEDPKVTIEGRLSMEKLAMVFPEYVALAQSAGNAAGQIASGEGELQLARKVNQAIEGFLTRTGKDTVSYADTAPGILRSKPPSGSSLPGIFTFVLRYGGGAGSDSFLAKTEKHIRAHGTASRSQGPEFWSALSTEIKGSSNQRVLWRHMLLKLAFCGPEKILNLGDIKRGLAGKDILPKAEQAEKLAVRMHQLLHADARLTGEVAAATLSEVEMEMAAVIFQKKKFTTRASPEQVCHDCLTGFGITSPFAAPPTTTSTASSPAKDASP
ncbi:unnamed protein product, partial [Symbiodinium microadriaticum]